LVHAKVYGEEVSVPNCVEPLKKATCVTLPLESAALAARFTVAGAVKLCPLVGLVNETVGAVLPPVVVVPVVGAALVVTAPVQATPFSFQFVGAGLDPVQLARKPMVAEALVARPGA
jgi:hypothetical protein